eukprot:s886_g12.t1
MAKFQWQLRESQDRRCRPHRSVSLGVPKLEECSEADTDVGLAPKARWLAASPLNRTPVIRSPKHEGCLEEVLRFGWGIEQLPRQRRIRWCSWCLTVAALGNLRPSRALNRLLLEPHELRHGRAVLPMSDRRARHVAKVLQLRDGEELKVGVLDGGYDDRCRILWRWPASGGQWLVETPRQMRPERLPMEEIVNVLEQDGCWNHLCRYFP